MPYWGKIVGTLVGLATGRWWIGVIGLILGHQFDRGLAQRLSGFERGASSSYQLAEGFVRALFQTIGHLAKADGLVTEAEIRAARALMHRLGLGPAEIRQAIRWFEAGKAPSFPLKSRLHELRREYARRADHRSLFVQLIMEVSLSKTSLHRSERAVIWMVCQEMDVGRVELAQIEAMLRAQRRFRKSPQGSADTAKVNDAYAVLGVDRSSTNAEIKTAYRRLMNRNHPDKIAANKPNRAEVDEAERKTREIRSAYDLLKVRRTIR